MVDTHCHLWFKHFKGQIPEVLKRAKDAGVDKMICVGCDEKSSRQSVEIAEKYDGVFAAVALHPCDAAKDGNYRNWVSELVAESNKVVAIGETGLDYYHEPYDAPKQREVFLEHCLLAKEFDLPVVVHMRPGKEDSKEKIRNSKFEIRKLLGIEESCLKILDQAGMGEGKVVFHCFPGGKDLAEEVLKRGFYISFAGPITFPKAENLREAAAMVPLDRLLVETDCPFLAPQKYRGERNEPAYVVDVAQEIAKLREIPYDDLEIIVGENVERVFGI